jgi:hypothetical protein
MARRGIDFCIKQYIQKIETNSVLNESTIAQLKKSIDICDTIAFKMRLPQIQAVAEKEGLIYLFNWNNIEDVQETRMSELKGEDTKKFVLTLQDENTLHDENGTRIDVINFISLNTYETSEDESVRYFRFTDAMGNYGNGDITLNFKEMTAHLSMNVQEVPWGCDFVIKTENGAVYVYRKET